jgi:hypothetical protein
VFRGVTESNAFQVRAGAARFERFIKRSFGMRVEVVANEYHMRAIGIASIQSLSDFDRPVGLGPTRAGGRLSETRQRFGEHENAGRAVAFVFIIDALAMLLRCGDRHPSFLEQLERLFIHTQHGMLGIVGFCVGFEHFFHAGHELDVLLRRNHPVLDLALCHAVFFSVLRTVS